MITNPLDRGWIVGIETNGHSRRERITTESLLSDELDEVKSLDRVFHNNHACVRSFYHGGFICYLCNQLKLQSLGIQPVASETN